MSEFHRVLNDYVIRPIKRLKVDHSDETYIRKKLCYVLWFQTIRTYYLRGANIGLADYLNRMYVENDSASVLTIEKQTDDTNGLMMLQPIMRTDLTITRINSWKLMTFY